MSSNSNRLYFIDFARSFAIVLALTDHSMNVFNVWHNYPRETFAVLKTITTSATPTFLLLFGMMLEIIYLRRLKKEGIRKMASQMINRSFQCYIGYFLTVLAGWAGGMLLFKTVISATFFLGNSYFGNILKLYTVMLLVAIPLVWFRNKYGIAKTVLLGLSPWIIYPLYHFIPEFQPNIGILTAYFFGFGGKAGPSILNGISLVVIGMLAASFIAGEKKNNFQQKTAILLVILAAAVVLIFLIVPVDVIVQNHITNTYRNDNNPIYYVFSTFLALVVALASSFIIPIGSKINQATYTFLAFGRSSLTAFTAGNIILNLIWLRVINYKWNFLAPVVFIIVVFLILQFYEKIYPRMEIVKTSQKFFRGLTVRFHWFYVRRISNGLARQLNNE